MVGAVSFYIFSRWRFNQKIDGLSWKIDPENIKVIKMASPEMFFDLIKAPYFFGSQENWAQTNTGPKKLGPHEIWFLQKNAI